MSQSGNKYQEFEDRNWQDLAEKFIKKYPAEWIDFVDMQYQQYQADIEPIDEDDNASEELKREQEEPAPEDR